MSTRLVRPKRAVRILTSSWPVATKAALLRAELQAGEDVEVPIGDGIALIAGPTDTVDYFTLYGSIIDQLFAADVKDAAVLDIGAHKGYYALRSLAEGAYRVDSYEPASQNLDSLNRSAEGQTDWYVHPVAVGATAGSVELHLSPGSWGHSVHVPVGGESVGTEQVEMISLSDALATITASGKPVVAKINVEGAAGSMIMGTTPEDWSAVRLLWTDIEVNDPVPIDDLLAHLQSCGLERTKVENHRHLFARR